MDVIAWIVLAVFWVFGWAAFFDNRNTKFNEVLLGIIVVHVLFVVALAVLWVGIWAVDRVIA